MANLFYILGRLESLRKKDKVKSSQLDFLKERINHELGAYDLDDSDDLEEDPEWEDSADEPEFDNEGNAIIGGDPRTDRDENPWLDALGPEEAEQAYWNTD